MAEHRNPSSSPLTFVVSGEVAHQLEKASLKFGLPKSHVIRKAVDELDPERVSKGRKEQVQASVRLTEPELQRLKAIASSKQTSLGELLRFALEDFLSRSDKDSISPHNQTTMPAKKNTKKAAAKKPAAKKAAPKKAAVKKVAAKKAAKKAPAKKAPAKKAAKKAVKKAPAKKASVRKAAAKKAPAKKAPAKKAAKKAVKKAPAKKAAAKKAVKKAPAKKAAKKAPAKKVAKKATKKAAKK